MIDMKILIFVIGVMFLYSIIKDDLVNSTEEKPRVIHSFLNIWNRVASPDSRIPTSALLIRKESISGFFTGFIITLFKAISVNITKNTLFNRSIHSFKYLK